jgi:hypothetical protein
MFRVLLAHPQKALHKRFFVYCVRVTSVGFTRFGVELVMNKKKIYCWGLSHNIRKFPLMTGLAIRV